MFSCIKSIAHHNLGFNDGEDDFYIDHDNSVDNNADN